MDTKTFISERGLDFTVVLLTPGEQGPTRARPEAEHAIVQFYDTRFTTAPFTRHGQLVASYHLETILPGQAGVILQAGSPDWSIDAATLNDIRAWLRRVNVWCPAQARELARLEAKLAANGGHGADTIAAIEALDSLWPPF